MPYRLHRVEQSQSAETGGGAPAPLSPGSQGTRAGIRVLPSHPVSSILAIIGVVGVVLTAIQSEPWIVVIVSLGAAVIFMTYRLFRYFILRYVHALAEANDLRKQLKSQDQEHLNVCEQRDQARRHLLDVQEELAGAKENITKERNKARDMATAITELETRCAELLKAAALLQEQLSHKYFEGIRTGRKRSLGELAAYVSKATLTIDGLEAYGGESIFAATFTDHYRLAPEGSLWYLTRHPFDVKMAQLRIDRLAPSQGRAYLKVEKVYDQEAVEKLLDSASPSPVSLTSLRLSARDASVWAELEEEE